MVIGLLFVALLTGTITFVTTLWFHGLPLAVISAIFTANVSMVLAAAAVAFRRTGSAEPVDEQWADPATEDQRKAGRVPGFIRGRLEWDDGRSGSDCIVHDLSDTGARLGIPTGAALPDIVGLYIEDQARTVSAKVCWRTVDQVGVEFLDESSDVAPDSDDLQEQNIELRAEIVRLRAMLDDRWADPRRSRM